MIIGEYHFEENGKLEMSKNSDQYFKIIHGRFYVLIDSKLKEYYSGDDFQVFSSQKLCIQQKPSKSCTTGIINFLQYTKINKFQ